MKIQLGKIYKKKKLDLSAENSVNTLLDLIYPDYILLIDYNEKTELNGEWWSQYSFIEVDKPDKKSAITKQTFVDLYELADEE